MREFVVVAEWDEEARVWVATSEDVPGLVAEAENRELLLERLRELVPEMLELNAHLLTEKQPGHEFLIHWTENQRVMYA